MPVVAGTLEDRIAAFLRTHQFFGYKDLRDDVFDGSTDALIDAYSTGVLPLAARQVLEDTLSPEWITVGLLRRVSRQLSALIAALG
jgi:hypothetical protein